MDDYDQALQSFFDTTPEQQAKANLFAGQQKPTDPSSVETARQLGYDLPTIDLDPKGFAAEAKFRKNSNIIDQSPAIASYVAESPVNAQVSHDDLGALSDFAKPWLTQGAALMNYYIKGMDWKLDWQKAMSQGFAQTDMNRRVAFDLAMSKPDRAGWEAQRNEEGLSPLAEMAGSFLGSTMSMMKTALPAAATGAAIGGPAGAAVGFAGGIAADIGITWFGNTYRELDAMRFNGQPLAESVKIIGALGAGSFATILGMVGGKTTVDLGATAVNKILGTVLTDPVVNSSLMRASGEILRSGLTFGGISAGMELGSIVAGEIGKHVSSPDIQTVFNNSDEVAKAAKRIAQGFVAGGTLGVVLGTVPAGINFFLDKARIGQTQLDAATLSRMSQVADESSTAKVAPEIFADYVQKHVGVTPMRMSAEAVASLRPGFTAEYQEAIEKALPHGGDIEVRAGDFFTKTDAKEREALIPYVRGQSGMTGVEAEVLAQRPPETYQQALQQWYEPALKPDIVQGKPSTMEPPSALVLSSLRPPDLPYMSSDNALHLKDLGHWDGDITAGRTFSVIDDFAGDHGVVNLEYNPQTKDVRVVSMEIRNQDRGLTRANAENLLGNLAAHYPEAETVSGLRITGARGEERPEVTMRLPKRLTATVEHPTPTEQKFITLATSDPRAVLIANEFIDKAKAYENSMWLGPMLNAGMTPAGDAVKYSKLLQERQRSLTESAMKAAEREIGRTETKLWKENLKDEMDAATTVVEERPDVQAHRRITEGIDGIKVVKLDRAEVEDALASLRQPHSVDMLSKYIGNAEGVPLDATAQISGFKNGRDMVEALVDMRREQEDTGQGFAMWRLGKIKEAANLAMEEKHGSLQDNIVKASFDAAISVEQLDVLTEDFKQRFNGTITRKGVMDYARTTLPDLQMAEARNIQGFMNAVQRKGQNAESWLLAGKLEEAFKAKQEQLYNFGLLQESRKFARKFNQGMRDVERFSTQLTPSGISQEYTDQIHAMLQRHNVPIPRSPENLAAALNEDLGAFTARLAHEGVDIVLNPTTDGVIPISLDKLTAGQFLEFKDTLDSLTYHGRLADKIQQLNSVADLRHEINELTLQFNRMPPQLGAERTNAAAHIVKMVDAQLMKWEQIADWIDADDIHGVFNRNVIIPLKNAQHFENDLKTEFSNELGKVKSPRGMSAEIDNTLFRNTETGKYLPMNKSNLIMAMLNLGNEGNKKVLLQGYDVSEAQVMGLINKYATKEDWDFAQNVWRAMDKLWPHIEKATREATGVAPDRVMPTKIKTDFGTVDGGYFPLIRDNTQDKVITSRGPFDLRPLPTFVTANSFKNRTGATYPIDLSLDLLPSRIVETIHAVAFKTPVREAQKIVGSDAMRRGINEKFGPEYTDVLGTWLKDVANNGRRLYANKTDAELQGFLSSARSKIITFLVGWRPSTAAIHSGSALSNSFGEVMFGQGEGTLADRGIELSRATKELFNPSTAEASWKFVNEKSGELRYRMQNVERDISDVIDRSFGKSTFDRQQAHHALALVGYSDKASAGMVWLTKYRLALKAGLPDEDAVQIADKAVRRAHGSQSIMDQADVQRGNEYKKMFTMFYGYFNHNYNRERDIARNFVKAWGEGNGLGMLAEVARLQTYITIPALVHEWIRGEQKEDESWGAYMARAIATQGTSTIPVVRDVGHFVLQGGEPSLSPMVEYFKTLHRGYKDIENWHAEKNDDPKFVRDSLEAIGLFKPGILTRYTAGLAQTLYDNVSGSDRADDQDFWRLIMEGNPTPRKER